MTARSDEARSAMAVAQAIPGPARRVFGVELEMLGRPERRVFGLALAASALGLAVGVAALFANAADALTVPAAALLGLCLLAAIVESRRRTERWDRAGVFLVVLSAAIIALLFVLPPYLYGWQLNAAIHRSAISGPLLLLASVLATSYALRRLLAASPRAEDLALYPLIALPVLLALAAYGMLLGNVLVQGLGKLSFDLVLTPWAQLETGASGGPAYQIGLRNHILGTLLLMVLTCGISFLPGVGVGVFLSEYPGRIARVVGFCTTMLRAMSVFIIGVAAFGAVGLAFNLAPDSFPSQLVRGSFILGVDGVVQAGTGSFVTAALFLSLLVIPVIAKLTEEGLRSVPRDLREGSVATGATEGFGLRRILLPWAVPNIVTGLLIGAAEAAGSLAIILFIAGDGQYGVGPLDPVTSLDYALYSTRYGSQPFIQSMGYRAETDYAFAAALLLLVITLGLTIAAIWLRNRFSSRYRGTLTAG